MNIISKIGPYWKAAAGVAVPVLTAVGMAVTEGSDGGATITSGEWIAAAVAGIVGGNAVFWTPNIDPAGRHQEESVQPPEPGFERRA